jgi:hypothetical protein
MKKVADDVLAFADIHVSTLQVYNHIRKWRTKCSVRSKIKSDHTLQWSKHGCCFYLGDEERLEEYLKVISFMGVPSLILHYVIVIRPNTCSFWIAVLPEAL